MTSFLLAFLPELVLLAGALGLFCVTLGESQGALARRLTLIVGLAAAIAAVIGLGQHAVLFDGAYRVDAFSQLLKVVLLGGFVGVALLSADLPDIRAGIKSEYFLFLTLSAIGLVTLVSCVDALTMIVALELSSFPLYLMVAMRRERAGFRLQMESAIKYVMFGVAANGIMFFGLSYLYGLTGTTSLPGMVEKLAPLFATSPLATAGLAMACCGLYYKLAVFPFHFWTPDVYQGASNETAGFVSTLPKLGAVAVLVRLVSLAGPDNHTVATLLTGLAIASMFYGNLVALVQKDFKRLLGFSGIAHAGYALVGLVALNATGFSATIFYISGYVLMVLACFVVITRVSRDGANLAISDLAGLHRRSPLLAVTLLVGVFGLAGIPPFVGFMAKLGLLTGALAQGHLALVIIAMINSAIAVYYYLQVVRQAVFGEKTAEVAPIQLDLGTRVLCVALIAGIVFFGVAPTYLVDAYYAALASINLPL